MRLPQALSLLPTRIELTTTPSTVLSEATREIACFGAEDWLPLPGGKLGRASIPLVAVGGTANHDFSIAGPVRPTPALERCPALKKLLDALSVPIARSFLVRTEPGATTVRGVDWNYHHYRRYTFCMPIVTAASVELQVGEEVALPAAGELWILDTSREYGLKNPSDHAVVFLVVESKELPGEGGGGGPLLLESPQLEVLRPEELARLGEEIFVELTKGGLPERGLLRDQIIDTFAALLDRWTHVFGHFGHSRAGELAYQDLLLDFGEQLRPKLAGTGRMATTVIETMLHPSPPAPRRLHRPPPVRSSTASIIGPDPHFERPIFIVSAPRSGSTLLFDLLARCPDVWTIGGESHEVIRGIPELHPSYRGYPSDRLTAAEATPVIIKKLQQKLTRRLVDRRGHFYDDIPAEERPQKLRFLEKTPANALRIPFLHAAFPDGIFVYLRRDARENISSLVEGWRSRRFLSYAGLPGWPYRDWSFLLIPGWSDFVDRPILEIAAAQWEVANRTIQTDLRAVPAAQQCIVHYDDLVKNPHQTLATVAAVAALPWDHSLATGPLPQTRVTLSAPSPDKWRRHAAELDILLSPKDFL